ncbi:hypothetical protein N0V90_001390 [Kalmusia sp. IMI 367209]|nr:hypothetical protein N0V90_001390 [Kalmusia sp. IMI 367209]
MSWNTSREWRVSTSGSGLLGFYTRAKQYRMTRSSISIAQNSMAEECSDWDEEQSNAPASTQQRHSVLSFYAGPEYTDTTPAFDPRASSAQSAASATKTKVIFAAAGPTCEASRPPSFHVGGLLSKIRTPSPPDSRMEQLVSEIHATWESLQSKEWCQDIPVAMSSFNIRDLAQTKDLSKDTRELLELSSTEYKETLRIEQEKLEKRQIERKEREKHAMIKEQDEEETEVVNNKIYRSEDGNGAVININVSA